MELSTEILIMLFLLMISIMGGHYLKKKKSKYLQEAGLTTLIGNSSAQARHAVGSAAPLVPHRRVRDRIVQPLRAALHDLVAAAHHLRVGLQYAEEAFL